MVANPMSIPSFNSTLYTSSAVRCRTSLVSNRLRILRRGRVAFRPMVLRSWGLDITTLTEGNLPGIISCYPASGNRETRNRLLTHRAARIRPAPRNQNVSHAHATYPGSDRLRPFACGVLSHATQNRRATGQLPRCGYGGQAQARHDPLASAVYP